MDKNSSLFFVSTSLPSLTCLSSLNETIKGSNLSGVSRNLAPLGTTNRAQSLGNYLVHGLVCRRCSWPAPLGHNDGKDWLGVVLLFLWRCWRDLVCHLVVQVLWKTCNVQPHFGSRVGLHWGEYRRDQFVGIKGKRSELFQTLWTWSNVCEFGKLDVDQPTMEGFLHVNAGVGNHCG